MVSREVGVFLSTLGISDVEQACATARELGFRIIQLGKLPASYYTVDGASLLAEILRRHGLEAVALCMVYDGESYADLESVRRTVGFVPASTVEDRVAYSLRCVDTAAALGIPLVTTHVGMIPADPADPVNERVRGAVATIAEHARARGVKLALETGQETAEELLDLIARVEAPVGVNFDGANFVAYGTQNPLEALSLLYDRTLAVHVKDYRPPASDHFIQPCPLGRGAARVDETLAFLMERGFAGPLIIEQYDRVDPRKTLTESRAYVLERVR